MADGAVLADGDGTIRYVSTQAAQMFGYEPHELYGRSVDILVPFDLRERHAADRARHVAAPHRVTTGKRPALRGLRKDGTELLLEIGLSPMRSGGSVSFLATLVDVTERDGASAAERRTGEQLRSFIDQAPVNMAMFDLEMNYVATSRRWVNEFGSRWSPLVGKNFYDVHPGISEAWKEFHRRALAGETIEKDADLWVAPDGTKRWLRWAVHPWTDANERIGGIIISGDDITARIEAETALRESEERLKTAFHSNPVGIVVTRARDGTIVDANEAMLHMLGRTHEEVIGRTTSELGAYPVPEERETIVAALRANRRMEAFETHFRRASGDIGIGLLSAELIEIRGEPHVLGMLADITARKRAEAALHASDVRFRSVVDQASDAFFVHTDEGDIVDVNRNACDTLGYSREELLQKNVWEIDHLLVEDGRALAANVRVGEPITFDGRARRRDGTSFPVEVRVGCIEADHERLFVSLMRDVSQRYELAKAADVNRQLADEVDARARATDALVRDLETAERRARTDPLTGLSNRRHFAEVAEHEWTRARRYGHTLAVLMMDLDHFKHINDVYGHHGGDLVLRTFARTCAESLREVDVLGRLGGEEFAVLLPETDHAEALAVANRIRETAAHTSVPTDDGRLVRFTTSIGVALALPSDASFDEAIKRADLALYEAKRAGRDRVRVA